MINSTRLLLLSLTCVISLLVLHLLLKCSAFPPLCDSLQTSYDNVTRFFWRKQRKPSADEDIDSDYLSELFSLLQNIISLRIALKHNDCHNKHTLTVNCLVKKKGKHLYQQINIMLRYLERCTEKRGQKQNLLSRGNKYE